MTAITVPTTTDTQAAAGTRVPTWKSGLGTAAVAAAVTTVVAVALRAAGVPLEIAGEEIPVLAFAQMVFLFSVVGIVIARRMSSATTFVRTTVVLTALSFVPDVTADASTATKLGLIVTHVVAAAIVIPRLARPLAD